jgi:lipopolysaccharide export system permease protein
LLIDGVRSTLQNPVRDDPRLWPVLYAPVVFGFLLVLTMLWLAAKPRRLRRQRNEAIA